MCLFKSNQQFNYDVRQKNASSLIEFLEWQPEPVTGQYNFL